MAKQRADNVDFAYYKQSAFGESPSSPTLQTLRLCSEDFKIVKKTVESQVLGARQVQKIYKVGEQFSANLKGELAHTEWDWAFEGVLGGTFTTFSTTQTDISFAASDSSINGSADFSSSVVAGQWIKVVGSGLHDGYWYVATKSSTSKMLLSNGVSTAGVTLTVQDESAGASITVTGKHLRQGTTLNSYTFERRNKDNSTFDVWNSLVVDSVKLSLKGEALVEIEVTGVGKVADLNNVATIAGSLTAQSSNDAYNSTSNEMRLKVGSTVLSDELVSLDLTIKANTRMRLSLGNTTPTSAAQGDVEVEGGMGFYFSDNARRQYFQDQTEDTFFTILKDSASKVFIVTMRRLYYQDLGNGAGGKNQDIMEQYGFKGASDATYAQTVCIDSLS